MTTSTDFISIFSTLSHLPRHEFDRIAARLREENLIPVGARGIHAPELSPRDAAMLFTTMAGSYRPKDALRVAEAYAKLKSQDGSENFLEVLGRLFAHPDQAEKVKLLRICRNITDAAIEFDDGTSKRFEGNSNPLFRLEALIEGALFHQLAICIQPGARGPYSIK